MHEVPRMSFMSSILYELTKWGQRYDSIYMILMDDLEGRKNRCPTLKEFLSIFDKHPNLLAWREVALATKLWLIGFWEKREVFLFVCENC